MSTRTFARSDAGFSLVEMMMTIALALGVLSIGLGGFNAALNTVRGDASMNVVLWQLKLARETAINQRRFVEIRFTPPNFMSVVRRDVPTGETVVSTAVLEHQTEFRLFPTLPDTPDSFGNASPIDFGLATAVMFNASGQFVDQTGSMINGTVFIGKAGTTTTARALTIFGPTSALRTFRWNGTQWRH
jgi:prepilin-type N-terminal cleavage/methylation domain-containing protein